MNNKNTAITDRLNELYKKYFQESDYKVGDSFDSVKANMTGVDYDLSQKLLNYYGQQNNLTNTYNDSSKTIENDRKRALQENAIARTKAMHYLQQNLKSQGLDKMGVSQSSIIQTANDYNNNRNTINSDAAARRDELLRNYNEGMTNLDNAYVDEEAGIKQNYSNNLIDQAMMSLETEYNNMAKDQNGKITQEDKEKLNQYIAKYKEELTGEHYRSLQEMVDGYSTRTEEDDAYDEFKSKYNIKDDSYVFDVKTSTLNDVEDAISKTVNDGKSQSKLIKKIMNISRNWGSEKNGTIVDFNVGFVSGNNKGNYYVFKDGKWYRTEFTKHTVGNSAIHIDKSELDEIKEILK